MAFSARMSSAFVAAISALTAASGELKLCCEGFGSATATEPRKSAKTKAVKEGRQVASGFGEQAALINFSMGFSPEALPSIAIETETSADDGPGVCRVFLFTDSLIGLSCHLNPEQHRRISVPLRTFGPMLLTDCRIPHRRCCDLTGSLVHARWLPVRIHPVHSRLKHRWAFQTRRFLCRRSPAADPHEHSSRARLSACEHWWQAGLSRTRLSPYDWWRGGLSRAWLRVD
jgi:hypothetical protein